MSNPMSNSTNTSNGKTTYWGILCRTCSQPVTFGTPDDRDFGVGSAYLRPGAIRCASGHNHIYFPRDFQTFVSLVAIPDALIEQTRGAYHAINPLPPAGVRSFSENTASANEDPRGDRRPEVAPNRQMLGKLPVLIQSPKTRRQFARKALRERWPNSLRKKVM